MKSYVLLGLAAFLAGCADLKQFATPIETQRRDPADLERLVDYEDDRMDTAISATTRPMAGIWTVPGKGTQDVYFSAAQDRQTKNVLVTLVLLSEWNDWLFPSRLNFGDPLRTVPVRREKSNVRCSSSGCVHFEASVAVLSDADIKAFLSSKLPVSMRYKTQRGDVDTSIAPAELEALLKRLGVLDRYQ